MSCQQNGLREAELTDWKDNRHFRLMAVDHGLLTWTDVPHQADGTHWPLILVTWPPGADTRAGDREPLYRLVTSTHIRLLVFSPIRVVSVTITLDTGEQVECSTDTGTLWTGPWSPGEMEDSQRSRVLEVRAEDEWGVGHVIRHEYTLGGGQRTWPGLELGRIILLLDMISFFQVWLQYKIENFVCKIENHSKHFLPEFFLLNLIK